ncbi:MAG TPA: hypothetical protein VFU47_13420 [Armatimonadota bacterium]|nr:hypothetical protein [Armatimonadota bacterium]
MESSVGHTDVTKALIYAALGFIGALIGSMAKERRLTLPRVLVEIDEQGRRRRVIDPGFVVAPLVGALMAVYFDARYENALAWGAASGVVGPAILNIFSDWALKRLGFSVQPHGAELPAASAGEGAKGP